jgi:predicted enzyme related to lactoylglutathione lyase
MGQVTVNYAPGRPNWVDLATTDPVGASAFYGDLFGWTTEQLGPEAGGYGLLRLHGKQVGGIGPTMDSQRPPSWAVYLATDDADDTASRVAENGGTVVMPPMDVMNEGRMAVFTDPSGAAFSVWEAGHTGGAEAMHEPGALSWAELMTSDISSARFFYSSVFPVGIREVPSPGGGTYSLIESDGESVAGAMQISPDMGPVPSHWSAYFEVNDCDQVANRAIELGATELTRQDSEAGRFAMLTDPQGAEFSIIAPNPDFHP